MMVMLYDLCDWCYEFLTFKRDLTMSDHHTTDAVHNNHAHEAHNAPDANGHADEANAPGSSTGGWMGTDAQTAIATAGVIVIGAALIEVALIPGMIVGVAAALAPKYVPAISENLRPAFRSIVRGAYKFGRKAREAAAEAQEQVQDIVAEVHAEGSQAASTPPASPHA